MLQVEIDSSKLQKALRVASTELRAEVADTIDHISRTFFKNLYQKRFQGPPGLRMGGRGNLFSRFRKRVIGQEGTFKGRASTGVITASLAASSASTEDMGMEVFTESKVAKIHEFGGTIAGENMPVPFPGKRITKGLEVLDINGRLFLARKRFGGSFNKAAREKPEFVGVLKDIIKIKPRLGFYTTWKDMENQTIGRFNSAISRALSKV